MKTRGIKLCICGIILIVATFMILALNKNMLDLSIVSMIRGRFSKEAVLCRLDRLRLGQFTEEDSDYFANQLPYHGEIALFADAELWQLLQDRPELTNRIVNLQFGPQILKKNSEVGQEAWADYYGQHEGTN